MGEATGRLYTLKEALAYSKNTITARLVDELGPHRVASVARRMGIKSTLDEVPSIGLGTSPVTLLEMAGAYAVLADQGRYREPIFVTRVEDRDGRVLATFAHGPRHVLSDYTAYSVLDMMRGVVEYGTGQRIRGQYGASGDLAAKTGTSQGGADGWFMLMHPRLVMGAWVGFSSPGVRFRSEYWGQGAHNALHIVGHFYREARRASDVLADGSFEAPHGYQPPAPDTLDLPDSLFYAYDDSLLFYYADTLSARADSLPAHTGATRSGGAGAWYEEADSAWLEARYSWWDEARYTPAPETTVVAVEDIAPLKAAGVQIDDRAGLPKASTLRRPARARRDSTRVQRAGAPSSGKNNE